MTTNVNFDTKLIRDLAQILDDTNLTDIEIEHDDARIRVSRHVTVSQTAPLASAPLPVVPSTFVAPASVGRDDSSGSDASAHKPENTVTSPMVGTAYLSPSPGSRAFIEIGQQIREQFLFFPNFFCTCIISKLWTRNTSNK